ncbi:MAG TPA: tetratricopeptide repeat protein [Phycisphaerae bacterium]|nr:tetratricopeptide repeat protein [Phycisphaerae bacterium]
MTQSTPILAPLSRREWSLALLLLLAALLPFLPTIHGQFQWDDEELHIHPAATTSNPLTFFSLSRSSATAAQGNYYPLSMLAFWCEARLFGADTTGYHAINLALHAGNVLLAWLLLRRLKLPWPFLIAMLFAIHPIVVETVAYISELKNLLSALFFLTAAHLWLSWQEQPGKIQFYLLMILAFLAAMLAKSTACTLPAAILLLEYFRHGRLNRRTILATLPLFLIAAALAAFFISTEHTKVGAAGAAFHFPLLDRILIASRALCFYLTKFLWPHPILVVYPRWTIDPGAPWQYLFPAAVIAAIAAFWLLRKKITRGPFIAAALFILLLSPSLGLIVYYPMLFTFVADHYAYLALLPLAAAFAALLQRLTRELPIPQCLLCGIIAVLLIPITVTQAFRWRTDITLWQPTVSHNPDNWYATANLAYACLNAGRDVDAQKWAAHSLHLKEDNPRAHFTLALGSLRQGDPAAAIAEYHRGLELEPTNAVAWLNNGYALEQAGQLADAEQAYETSLHLDNNQPKIWNELAVLRLRRGAWPAAAAAAQNAVALAPTYGLAYANLALALEMEGNIASAIPALERALRLLPPNDRLQEELARLQQMQAAPTPASRP